MIHIHWHPVFTCDGCATQAQGIKQLVRNDGNIPSFWEAMPSGWYRSYGWDLCPACKKDHDEAMAAARKANKARWFNKLFGTKPRRVYYPMWQVVRDLRKRHGLAVHPGTITSEERALRQEQARAAAAT